MDVRDIITAVFLFIGCFFILISSIGIVRFPDFYSRIHAAGKTDTLGHAFTLLALMIYEGISFVTVKLLFIVIFVSIANPTATHAAAQAAYLQGLEPWGKDK